MTLVLLDIFMVCAIGLLVLLIFYLVTGKIK